MNGIENEYFHYRERAEAAIVEISERHGLHLTDGARQAVVALLVSAGVETSPTFGGYWDTRSDWAPTFLEPKEPEKLFVGSLETLNSRAAILASRMEPGSRVISGIGLFREISSQGRRWLGKCPGPY